MHKNTSKKGFTLVEIMIVVVIIGLLASMAIPAFNKVRQSSRGSKMDNDARQLASAAQQYMLENSKTVAAVGYVTTGALATATSDLEEYVATIGQGYTVQSKIYSGSTFTMTHPQAGGKASGTVLGGKVTYTSEGQKAATQVD